MALEFLNSPQRKTRVLPLIVSGSGTPTISEGTQHATVSRSAAGTYTITFNVAFSRIPVVVAQGLNAAETNVTVTAVSATSFSVLILNAANTAVDRDSHYIVIGFDAAEQR